MHYNFTFNLKFNFQCRRVYFRRSTIKIVSHGGFNRKKMIKNYDNKYK